jgi:acyl dehydratase
MEGYRVRARNTATDSENRIHDDQTAAVYGFRGGLTPGVTVYGYLTVPVIRRFGLEWLERGAMSLRFHQPVYDGEEVVAVLNGNCASVCRQDGPEATVCATGDVLRVDTEAPSLADYPEEALPAERPPGSSLSLAPGRILGTVRASLSLPDDAFLAMQDEVLPVYQEGILHPAALLSLSNQALLQNVKLGPWIHVASELRHFNLARDGDQVAARARVAERFERKGNQFVVLDVLVVASGDRIVQHVRHTAIYEPRLAIGSRAK